MKAFLAQQDSSISVEKGSRVSDLKNGVTKKKKATITQRKQDIFFEFMANLFDPDSKNTNKFVSRGFQALNNSDSFQ